MAFGALLAACDTESDPFSVGNLYQDGWRLVVDPADVALDLGSSLALTAYLENPEGHRRTLSSVGLEVEWLSERPDVAPVDESGNVRAEAPGVAEIDAELRSREGNLSANASVSVTVPPALVQVENTEALTGEVGASVEEDVRVKVLGPNDIPASGVRVRFEVESGNGSVSPSAAWTDSDGTARTSWILGPEVGEQTLRVSAQSGTVVGSSGQGPAPEVEVRASATPSEPEQIGIFPPYLLLTPDSSATLEAEVHDGFGNLVPDAPVTWQINKPWMASITTEGVVEATVEGVAIATATTGELESRVTVVVSQPDDSREIEKIAGDDQSGTVDQALDTPVQVRVTDGQGQGLEDVEVVWNVTGGGGWTNATNTTTDAAGVAEVTWTLGTRAGAQNLTASAVGAGTVTFDAYADAGSPYELVIAPATLTLTPNETGHLSAEVRDEFGNTLTNTEVDWVSMNGQVATVSPSGQVTARNTGNATVGASYEHLEGWALVRVDGSAPPSGGGGDTGGGGTGGGGSGGGSGGGDTGGELTLVRAGGNAQTGTVEEPLNNALRVRVMNDDGTGASGESVSWSVTSGGGSLSQSSTTTDGSGYSQVNWILGTTAGAQGASATVAGVGSVSFSATAEPGRVTALEVSPASLSLEVGSVAQLDVSAVDSHGNDVTDPTVEWTSSDESVATVGAEGQVEGIAEGAATVTGSVDGVSADVAIEVVASEGDSPEKVQDLTVVSTTDSSVTLEWTQVDDGTGEPAKYAIRYGSPTITWWDAYETEVSVIGTAVGETQQYHYSGLDPSTEYEFRLVPYRGSLGDEGVEFGPLSNEVMAETDPGEGGEATVASVSIDSESLSFVSLGETKSLSTTAMDSTGTILSDVSLSWESSNTSVATVDAMGNVLSQGTGTALIIVSAVCCVSVASDTAEVSVDQEVASVEVSPSSVSLNPNESVQLTATALDAEHNPISGSGATWTSSNIELASVTPSGTVTGLAEGVVTITASSDGYSGSSTVTVTEASNGGGNGLLFSDSFESGDLTHSENGFRWVGTSGSRTFVSSERSFTGSHSFAFRYGPDAAGEDSSAQRRFVIAPDAASAPSGVWMEFMLWVPSNFHHRDDQGSDNNKLLSMWAEDYSNNSDEAEFTYEYQQAGNGTSRPRIAVVHGDTYHKEGKYPNTFTDVYGKIFPESVFGSWIQIRIMSKITSDQTEPVVRVWRDGSLILEVVGMSTFTTGGVNYLRNGYLFGWSNSGFSEVTTFYMDDLKVYTDDPGW